MAGLRVPLIFTSDLHIDPCEPRRIRHFVDFLRFVADRGAVLYILGDLFNFWAGDAQARWSSYRPMVRALRRLSHSGGLFFLHGNRDFLFSFYWRKKGGKVVSDGTVLAPPLSAVLYHGDALCTADREFQKIRTLYESAWIYEASRFLPGPLCMKIGRTLRERSMRAAAGRDFRKTGADRDCVERILRATGAGRMICGHFHRSEILALDVGGIPRTVYFLPESREDAVEYLLWEGDRLAFERFA